MRIPLTIANIFGGDGLIVVILAVVALFGGSQLPKLAKNVGSAGREFRKAQEEADNDAAQSHAAAPAGAPPVILPAPIVVMADDKLALGRSELRHELSDLLDQRHGRTDR